MLRATENPHILRQQHSIANWVRPCFLFVEKPVQVRATMQILLLSTSSTAYIATRMPGTCHVQHHGALVAVDQTLCHDQHVIVQDGDKPDAIGFLH